MLYSPAALEEADSVALEGSFTLEEALTHGSLRAPSLSSSTMVAGTSQSGAERMLSPRPRRRQLHRSLRRISKALVLEEVIVTARKREENLHDTPLSITAFTEEEIRHAGFQDLDDIARQTAGVVYDGRSTGRLSGRISSAIRVRGAQVHEDLPFRQATSLFVDCGIYAFGGNNSIPLNDLERVEIIKGPQSALFGRNTFAGAVNCPPRPPTWRISRPESTRPVANHGQYDVNLLTSGPIVEGMLGYQIAVKDFHRGAMYFADDGGGLGEES